MRALKARLRMRTRRMVPETSKSFYRARIVMIQTCTRKGTSTLSLREMIFSLTTWTSYRLSPRPISVRPTATPVIAIMILETTLLRSSKKVCKLHQAASSIDPDFRWDKSFAASLLSCASPVVSASRTGRPLLSTPHDQADAAEQAARCPACERPPCPERHLLGLAIRRTVARSAAGVWPLYYLL